MAQDEPLTKAEVQICQDFIGHVSTYAAQPEMLKLLDRYLEQSRPQWSGSLDAVLLQNMSLTQLEKSKRNLRFLCEMGMRIKQITDIRTKFIEKQKEDQDEQSTKKKV